MWVADTCLLNTSWYNNRIVHTAVSVLDVPCT